MNKQLTIGLAIGVVAGLAVGCLAWNHHGWRGDRNGKDMDHAMESMTKGLLGKTGDEFDMSFMREMITHHEGAIYMATLARTHAYRDEIKALAETIITAQTAEIKMMETWRDSWYSDTPIPAAE